MKKILVAALLAAALVTGCTAFQDAQTGEFELLVSDQQAAIGDFSSLEVSFSEVRVFPGENATNETEEGYTSIDAGDRSVDLTTVVGASAESLVNASLEAGNYSKIELHVSGVDAVVDGESVAVQVPSEKLMITQPFTIAPNRTTRFVFDIHVVQAGATGRYVLRPVISESGVVGEDDVEEPEPSTAPDGDGAPADAAP